MEAPTFQALHAEFVQMKKYDMSQLRLLYRKLENYLENHPLDSVVEFMKNSVKNRMNERKAIVTISYAPNN